MDKILICISGWGSHCQIFDQLINQCPKLAERSKIELPWQNFVTIPQSEERSSALYRYLLRELKCDDSELEGKDLLILAWSLGSLLALELSLEFWARHGKFGSPSKPQKHARLILLGSTAAMCPQNPVAPAVAGPEIHPYLAVNPIVLKLMQRKLGKSQDRVLQDFVTNCQTNQANQAELSGQSQFREVYWEQANALLATPGQEQVLTQGLDYLIDCDLRQRLCSNPLPYASLLLSGCDDAIIPAGQGEALAQLLPSAQFQLIGGGHNLLIPPAKGLNQRITEFLQYQL